jgi:hypothetical protein
MRITLRRHIFNPMHRDACTSSTETKSRPPLLQLSYICRKRTYHISDLDDESLRAVPGKIGWLVLLRKEQLCNQNLQVILADVNFVGHVNLCCAEAQADRVRHTACVAVLPMDPFHHLLAVKYGL